MKTYLIKSYYEYEIEAKNKDEAIEKWSEIIEEELGDENKTLATEMVDYLYAEETCMGCGEPILEGQAVVKGESRHAVCS